MADRQIVIGVGAVVFKGDAVLVIKRGKPPLEGRWSIPGGGLEVGERLVDAVHREVREETALKICVGGLIGVFEALPGLHTDPSFDRHIVMIDYWATWVSGELAAGDDAEAAEFVSLAEALQRVAWVETRRAIEDAVKLRDIVMIRP
jgi:8-oxo-dGTP diphosphatase